MVELEKSLTERLGTRVIIETNAEGGRLLIDFFSPDDLTGLVAALSAEKAAEAAAADMPVYPNTTQLPPDDAPEDGEDDLYAVSGFTV